MRRSEHIPIQKSKVADLELDPKEGINAFAENNIDLTTKNSFAPSINVNLESVISYSDHFIGLGT